MEVWEKGKVEVNLTSVSLLPFHSGEDETEDCAHPYSGSYCSSWVGWLIQNIDKRWIYLLFFLWIVENSLYIQNVVIGRAQIAPCVHSIYVHIKNLKCLLLTQTLIVILFSLSLSFLLISKLKFLTGKTGKETFVVDFPNTNLAFIIWLWQPSLFW